MEASGQKNGGWCNPFWDPNPIWSPTIDIYKRGGCSCVWTLPAEVYRSCGDSESLHFRIEWHTCMPTSLCLERITEWPSGKVGSRGTRARAPCFLPIVWPWSQSLKLAIDTIIWPQFDEIPIPFFNILIVRRKAYTKIYYPQYEYFSHEKSFVLCEILCRYIGNAKLYSTTLALTTNDWMIENVKNFCLNEL